MPVLFCKCPIFFLPIFLSHFNSSYQAGNLHFQLPTQRSGLSSYKTHQLHKQEGHLYLVGLSLGFLILVLFYCMLYLITHANCRDITSSLITIFYQASLYQDIKHKEPINATNRYWHPLSLSSHLQCFTMFRALRLTFLDLVRHFHLILSMHSEFSDQSFGSARVKTFGQTLGRFSSKLVGEILPRALEFSQSI